jgi:GTP cyclohydrolase III
MLKIDNQSTIELSKNLVFLDRSKHIDTKYDFIRQCVEEGRVRVEHIDTNQQLADILTKSHEYDCYIELRTKLALSRLMKSARLRGAFISKSHALVSA